jgi:hypothetical protein
VICENEHVNPEGLKFCRSCGVPLDEMLTPETPTDEDTQVGSPPEIANESDEVATSSSPPVANRSEQPAFEYKEQSSVTNLTIWGIVLSLLLGAIGGIVGIILGRKALEKIDRSNGGIRGRGGALTTIIIGTAAIVWSIGIGAALLATSHPSSTPATQSTTKPTYTVDWTDEVFGATCSQVSSQYGLDYSLPVRVFGPSGQQVALGIMGSGSNGSATNSQGERVNTCTYGATIRSVPKGLGTYIISDFGTAEVKGLTFSEKNIANDSAGEERGNY